MRLTFLAVTSLVVVCTLAGVAPGQSATAWAAGEAASLAARVNAGEIEPIEGARSLEALWQESNERYSDPRAVFDARLELVLESVSLLLSDWSVQRSGTLVGMARGTLAGDAEADARALYARGLVGLGLMRAAPTDQQMLSAGRLMVRDSAGDPAAAGWCADYLNGAWSYAEPRARLQRSLADRVLEEADAVVGAELLASFSRFMLSADRAERERWSARCVRAAETAVGARDRAVLELFLAAQTGAGSGTLAAKADGVMDVLTGGVPTGGVDADAAQQDVAVLLALAGAVGARALDAAEGSTDAGVLMGVAMGFVERASSIAETRLADARLDAARVGVGRMTKRLTGSAPVGYAGPPLDRFVAGASLGMDAPVRPWAGEKPVVRATLRLVAVVDQGDG